MILIVLAIVLVLMFFNDPKQFPFYLVVYYVFYDMFDGFYQDNKIYAVLRYVVPLMLLFTYCFRYNVFKKLPGIFIVLITYLFGLWMMNSGDAIVTSRYMLAIIITLIMVPIGQHFAENIHSGVLQERKDIITSFEKFNRILLIAIPLYIVYANKAGIGGFYSEAFSTGYLITSRIYIIPIVVFLAIHYILDSSENKGWMVKSIDITFILINVCIVLINTRRTALAMLLAAILIYSFYNRKLILKMVSLLFIVIAGLILSYPLYEDRLSAQLEKRERIVHVDTYEDEARILETLYIMDYHNRHKDVMEVLYGIKLFDTYDFGLKYFRRDRPIHSDINMIFFSTGLVGIIIFMMFFINYFVVGNNRILWNNKKLYFPLAIMLLITLLPGRFIGTLTFAPLLMLLLTGLKNETEYSGDNELAEIIVTDDQARKGISLISERV